MTRRFLERFCLIAFGLYHIPLFVNNYPSLGGGGFNDTGLAPLWGHVFTVPGIWVARHLFGMTGPMTQAIAGDNGDVGEEWARMLLAVVIGLVVALAWTAYDRAKPNGGWVRGANHVLLRYSIALGLASYAIAKILPQQFPPLTAASYEVRVGELAPMRLLWNFMQYSRPYNFFGGVMECVAVILLCFRSTATAGALTAAAVMTNVALMNWAYDVPVKLYATMVLVSAIVLVIYDAPRLLAVFVANRGTSPAPLPTLFEGRIPPAGRAAIKAVLVGSVVLSSVLAMAPSSGRVQPPTGVNGPWGLTTYIRTTAAPDTSTSAIAWRRVIIDRFLVSVRLANDAMMRCRRADKPDSTTIAFTCSRNRAGELHGTVSGNTMQLDGTFDGGKVTAAARRLDEKDYPLMRGGLHIITDRQ